MFFLWIEDHQVGLLNQFVLPAAVKLLIAFVLFDLWIYLWHRANHLIPFLWRFHQIHHSDLEMDMSTALRFHPIEILLASMFNILIFTLIGMNLDQIILYKLVFHTNVLIQHSNVALPERWDRLMRYVIVTPNMHRVHHSMKREETDSNYASVLSFCDRIFGSYRESDPRTIVFGLESERSEEDQKVTHLLKLPFTRDSDR